jgi:hypothetical protein
MNKDTDVAQVASNIAVPEARLSGNPVIQCGSLLPFSSTAFNCSAHYGLLTNAINTSNYTALNLESLVICKLERIRKELAVTQVDVVPRH